VEIDMKFRAALIGLGRMGAVPSARLAGRVPDGWLPLTHAEVIKSFPEFELIALCDSDESKQAEFARYYGVEHVYGDHRMLLTSWSK
jgi:predicted dehydrogenase